MLSDNDSVIEDPYPDLKQLLPVDMVTFAYQIADGMVSNYFNAITIIYIVLKVSQDVNASTMCAQFSGYLLYNISKCIIY